MSTSSNTQGRHPLKITDTTMRDAHQSLYATRVRTEDLLEIAARLDTVGFHSLEVWGGATFDVMHRFLQENPFDRLRRLKKVAPKTPFQMLLRGQNLVGYRNYPDDVVESFVKHSADVGVDVFRVFDALNDPRNLETAARGIKKCGKHLQTAVSFSLTERKIGGPVFNDDYYIQKAKQFADLGADSLCIKDMAGMISPFDAEKLVTLFKQATNLPVQIHTHFTSGMADIAYWRAMVAGADVVDCALAPFAMGTSSPACEPFVVALEDTEYDTGLDVKELVAIGHLLEKIAPMYRRFRDTSKVSPIDTSVLIHQIPGGMASNMINQLKQADALHRLPEVHAELPRTRKELGFPPLVTPTSQIVGTQAVMNVLMGRYKVVSGEVKDLCYGLYGRTPVPIDPEVRRICLKGYPRGEEPIEGRPADYLKPEMDEAVAKVRAIYEEADRFNPPDLDHILIYALYPRTGEAFLRWVLGLIDKRPGEEAVTLEDVKAEDERIRKALAGQLVEPPQKPPLGPGASTFVVAVDGEVFEVQVEGNPNGYGAPVIKSATPVAPSAAAANRPRASSMPPAAPKPQASALPPPMEGNQVSVTAPMPGTVIQYLVAVGDEVKEGHPILTLEAMKMANQIAAPKTGTVKALGPSAGAAVSRGQWLVVIE